MTSGSNNECMNADGERSISDDARKVRQTVVCLTCGLGVVSTSRSREYAHTCCNSLVRQRRRVGTDVVESHRELEDLQAGRSECRRCARV